MNTTRYSSAPIRQSGFIRRALLMGFAAGFIAFVFLRVSEGSASAIGSIIKSGVSGYCLDDYKDRAVAGNEAVLWSCNGSLAQSWSMSGDNIVHHSNCLGVAANSKTDGSPVVTSVCNGSPGQVWLQDKKGYFNPNSDMCLTAPAAHKQLTIAACSSTFEPNQSWTLAPFGNKNDKLVVEPCHGVEGQLVACYAEREWAAWQSGTESHTALLNKYTDSAPYEAWCADFVSYVYKQAGYPFASAYDGWDENNANNIQNYGFTVHMASTGYIPKPGDVAYFDYNGGHVEIVVNGGKIPTFVYGDSATIDPSTGNGQMKANTIVSDGPEGKLVYYLSPN